MNGSPSHVGDLTPLSSDAIGNVFGYSALASRPTMWGPQSIIGRSMVAYSDPDDFGLGPTDESLIYGNMGEMIACCLIRPMKIVIAADPVDYAEAKVDGRGRMLDDDEGDVFTPEEFRELFEMDYEEIDAQFG